MKKVLFILLVLVNVSIFSQVVYVDTLANGSDTVYVQNLWGEYESVGFTVKNLSSTACTLGVYIGYFVKNSVGSVYDTTWFQPPYKDSVYTNASSIIVSGAIGRTNSVMIQKPFPQIFKAWIKNTTGGNVQTILEGH